MNFMSGIIGTRRQVQSERFNKKNLFSNHVGKKYKKVFFADFCMEIYIMSQSALSLPVFLNIMLGAYENNDIKSMYGYAGIWFVLSVLFLILRYWFDILVNGKFYYSTLAEVREQCIKKIYNGSSIQIDKNYDGNRLYSFLSEQIQKFVNMMFRLNRILANIIVILIFGIWSISVGNVLSVVAFLGSVLVLVIGNYESKKINLKNRDVFEKKSKLVGKLRSIFIGTQSYLINRKYSEIVKEYQLESEQYIRVTEKIANQKAHRGNLIRCLDGIEYLLLIIICYVFVKEENVRIIITMIAVYNTMKSYMNRLNDNAIYVIENIYVAEQYDELLKEKGNERLDSEEYIFKAEKISYIVDENVILDSIDFEMKENRKIALIGKNGAGKSTLLKILLSVLKPTDGIVRRNQKKSYAYVPVAPQLFPVSIEDNIRYGTSEAEVDKLTELEEAADLSRIGEESLKEVLPDGDENLSGGEAQRVAIARAMAAKGDVLIADEPTANLDIITARKVFENLIHTSASVLFTTHDPQLLQYADEIYMMENGRVVCSGIYEEICKLKIYKEWECEAMKNI